MTPDPYEAGPPEYQPDEEPSADDIGVLYAAAAYEMTTWEWIREQEREAEMDRISEWWRTEADQAKREAGDG